MKTVQQIAPLKILLADDDIDDRSFFAKVLKEIPVVTKLITVNNGEELMVYLNENITRHGGTDVLFLDLSMPRKTGFECLFEIRENEMLNDLYIIMFTTSFTRGIDFEGNLKNTLFSMGAQGYIRKPGEFEELKRVIHEALIKVIEKMQLAQQEK